MNNFWRIRIQHAKRCVYEVSLLALIILAACTPSVTPAPEPTSIPPTSSPTIPTALANPSPTLLKLDIGPDNVDLQKAVSNYAQAFKLDAYEVLTRIKENPQAIVTRRDKRFGIVYIVLDPATQTPLLLKDSLTSEWKTETALLGELATMQGINFALGGISPPYNVLDPRIKGFNTVEPFIFGFRWEHRNGLDYDLTSPRMWVTQMTEWGQRILGVAPVPCDFDEIPMNLFKGMSEDQAIAVLEKDALELTQTFPQVAEWQTGCEMVWGRGPESGFNQGYPWYLKGDPYPRNDPDYFPLFLERVANAYKRGNPNALRAYSDDWTVAYDTTGKAERIFDLVKTLYRHGLIEKFRAEGHFVYGPGAFSPPEYAHLPPPTTDVELKEFKEKVKGRIRRYVATGIPFGLNEIDVIFTNASTVPEAERALIAGNIIKVVFESYLEVLNEVPQMPLEEQVKTKIMQYNSIGLWGLHRETSWITRAGSFGNLGDGHTLYARGNPEPALYLIGQVFFAYERK